MRNFVLIVILCFETSFSFGQNLHRDTTFMSSPDGRLKKTYTGTITTNTTTISEDSKGGFLMFNVPWADYKIDRIKPSGFLDDEFNLDPNLEVDDVFYGVLDKEDRILLCGWFPKITNGVYYNHKIVRLLPDGEIDTTFNKEEFDGDVNQLKLLPDSSVLVLGNFKNFGSISTPGIAKLKPNGDLDSSFTSGASASYKFEERLIVELQSDGKIILGNGYTYLVRLNQDGSLDNSFQFNSTGIFQIESLVVLPNDEILLSSTPQIISNTTPYKLKKFNKNGGQDLTVNDLDIGRFANEFTLLKNGNVLIKTGSYTFPPVGFVSGIIEIDQNGSVVNSIKNSDLSDGAVNQIYLTSDNELLLNGDFDYCLNRFCYRLAKISTKGLINNDFRVNNGFDSGINGIYPQQNGKIFIKGSFDHYKGHYCRSFACLNSNGSFDESFNYFIGDDSFIHSMDIFPNGDLLVARSDKQSNGTYKSTLLRYSSTGILLSNYNYDEFLSGSNGGSIAFVKIQADKKIMVIGSFTEVGNYPIENLARLNSDGSIDKTFNHKEISFGKDAKLRTLSNGQIIISGKDLSYDNYQKWDRIISLNQDGSLTDDFNWIENYFNFEITEYDEIHTGHHRYDSLGNLDSTYQPQLAGLSIESITPLKNKEVLLSGKYNNEKIALNNLIKLDSLGKKVSNFNKNNIDVYFSTSLGVMSNGDIIIGYENSGTAFASNDGFRRYIDESSFLDYCPLKMSFEANKFNCLAVKDSIIAQGYNGEAPYSYSWNSNSSLDSIIYIDTTGSYKCIISDNRGCVDSASVWVKLPTSATKPDMEPFLSANTFRPGRPCNVTVYLKNYTCIQADGEFMMVLDSITTFLDGSLTPDEIKGDTLIWNYSGIDVLNQKPFMTLNLQADTTSNIGDSIYLSILVASSFADNNPLNNDKDYVFPVVNSYDPNDIAVFPTGLCEEGYINKNQELTYKVRFQNTGNAPAIDIVVKDTISGLLDLYSLEVIGASHEVVPTLKDSNIIHFNFKEIWLADSMSNEPNSHGEVIFKLKQKSASDVGDVLKNRVGIYFDFNEVVMTNQVHNTIKSDLFVPVCKPIISVDDLEFSIKIYPNPVSDYLFIQNYQGESYSVYDNVGKLILTSKNSQIDVKEFNPGVYFIKMVNRNAISKFIVIKK